MRAKTAAVRASEVAYRQLKDEIIQWRLEPGTALGEVEQAARLGVSRTPLREALSRLVAEGLVSTDAGRTAIVAPLSLRHIHELFELREALETQAARLAARRRDPEAFLELKRQFLVGPSPGETIAEEKPYFLADRLDEAIDEAVRNSYLQNALRDLRGHLARVRRNAQSNPARLAQATAEHILIVDAVIQGDQTLAAQATAVHLKNSLDNVVSTLPILREEAAQAEDDAYGPGRDGAWVPPGMARSLQTPPNALHIVSSPLGARSRSRRNRP